MTCNNVKSEFTIPAFCTEDHACMQPGEGCSSGRSFLHSALIEWRAGGFSNNTDKSAFKLPDVGIDLVTPYGS